MIECLSRLHDRQLVYGKCRKTCIKHLLIERAGQGVGHKRSVCHCVDVLYQVMKEVTVRARKQEKTGQKQITFEKPVKAKILSLAPMTIIKLCCLTHYNNGNYDLHYLCSKSISNYLCLMCPVCCQILFTGFEHLPN